MGDRLPPPVADDGKPPPPGWYAHPVNTGYEIYWDGRAWSGAIRALSQKRRIATRKPRELGSLVRRFGEPPPPPV